VNKNLKEHLAQLKQVLVNVSGNVDFIPSSLSASSARVSAGSVFVAVKGQKNDGHNFIKNAIGSGASAIVFQDGENLDLPNSPIPAMIKVSDSRLAYSILLESFNDFPSSKLKLVGITGTNGKTTCAYLIRKFLSSGNGRCGLISTVEYSTPSWSMDASRTTPDPEFMQYLFSKMIDERCQHAVMEVSSHGLDQNRTGNAKFAGAIFTNLSGDHLDYHKNMENYFQAKKRLFSDHLAEDAFAVINVDDIYGKRLFSEIKDKQTISCGFGEASDACIRNFSGRPNGLEFDLVFKGESRRISSNLCGRYNAMNIAESFILAMHLGAKPEEMFKILQDVHVPGRLEKILLKNGAVAFVDYAHTDDALEKVLSTLNEIKEGRIICVFGCGGDRDKSKRPRMGAVSAKFADISIITSDNPRSENPLKIIEEIIDGVKDRRACFNIPDRAEAIRTAVEISKANDIIIVAGKGHEKGQQFINETLHFDDREELAKYAK